MNHLKVKLKKFPTRSKPWAFPKWRFHNKSTYVYWHLIVKAELSKSVIKTDRNGKCFRLSMEPCWCQNQQQLEETIKIMQKNTCPYRESNPGPLGLEPNTFPPTPSEPLLQNLGYSQENLRGFSKKFQTRYKTISPRIPHCFRILHHLIIWLLNKAIIFQTYCGVSLNLFFPLKRSL